MSNRFRTWALVAMALLVLSMGSPIAAGAAPDLPASPVPAGPVAAGPVAGVPPDSGELVYSTEGNRLRRYDVDTIGTGAFAEDILVQSRASDPVNGHDINGEMCFVPDGSGRFVAGEDTGQPNPPAGWGVFEADGRLAGKLTATYFVGGAEPHGCEFAANGTLFTSEVGFQGFGTTNGQLILWFPPYDQFPGPPGAYPATNAVSTSFCKLATDLGTAGGVAIDALGRVYVTQSAGLKIERFSPPFPTGPDAAGGCGGTDSTGAPVATAVQRETFALPTDGMLTFSGAAIAPNGNLYASSVLTGRIAEYDLNGNLVRLLLAPTANTPPIPTGHPQGLAVGADGTVYYADLDLIGTLPNVRTGPNGKVRRIRFAADGTPMPPEVIKDRLAFPDGVSIAPGNLQTPDPAPPPDWPTLAGGPNRQFFNPGETALTPNRVGDLIEKWRFPTGAVVTASPSVSTIVLPGGRSTRAVFFPSWDGNFYAVDFADGTELWRVPWDDQPGASFPAAASPTVTDIGGQRVVLMAAGEIMYALDAATGAERWRFTAGTGCRDSSGNPPGLCGFAGERNQIESTPIVAEGTVYFGMDINDVETGKGGFYGVNANDGRLTWYFDLETGATCRPNPSDVIRKFDGYHSESQLGLPAGFFATRSGCGHDRTTTGCGNVWSSPAHDPQRRLLYFGTSNCDTDDNPSTPIPGPTMPPYDAALVAIRTDGTPAWRWRPREVDNADLAFGAVPNLFTINVDGTETDVVGIGNKDGTYYVIDRDGVNERSGAAWNGPTPLDTPYWTRKVVPGGAIGGIIATASVDQAARQITFTTAPGTNLAAIQRPTVHALDLDTGAIRWQNQETAHPGGDASYGPTSGVPGLVIVGSVITPHLRIYNSTNGSLLYDKVIGQPGTLSGIASGAAVVDGTILVGAGIGARSGGGSSPGDFSANTPSALIALCVPGTPSCPAPPPRLIPGHVTVTEGDTGTSIATVPLTLSRPSSLTVTARWETLVVFPESADDLVPASGTVTLPPGTTSASIDVEVRGDLLDENDEFGVIRFFNQTNSRPGGYYGLSVVQILDNDPLPSLVGRLALGYEADGPSELRIPVQLSAPSGRAVAVNWSTADGTAQAPGDYLHASGRLVIPAGATRGEIVIQLVGDDIFENGEWFAIDLDSPENATIVRTRSLAIIIDDDDI